MGITSCFIRTKQNRKEPIAVHNILISIIIVNILRPGDSSIVPCNSRCAYAQRAATDGGSVFLMWKGRKNTRINESAGKPRVRRRFFGPGYTDNTINDASREWEKGGGKYTLMYSPNFVFRVKKYWFFCEKKRTAICLLSNANRTHENNLKTKKLHYLYGRHVQKFNGRLFLCPTQFVWPLFGTAF